MTRPALGLAVVGLGASLAPLDIAVNVAGFGLLCALAISCLWPRAWFAGR